MSQPKKPEQPDLSLNKLINELRTRTNPQPDEVKDKFLKDRRLERLDLHTSEEIEITNPDPKTENNK